VEFGDELLGLEGDHVDLVEDLCAEVSAYRCEGVVVAEGVDLVEVVFEVGEQVDKEADEGVVDFEGVVKEGLEVGPVEVE